MGTFLGGWRRLAAVVALLMGAGAVGLAGEPAAAGGGAAGGRPEVVVPETVTAADIQAAIQTLLALPAPVTEEEAAERRRDPAARQAWATLAHGGEAARTALHAALKDAPEGASVFKLAAGTLLWRIGRLDEAAFVADLWTRTAFPQAYGAPMVHATAYAAARTRDPRALPLMYVAFADVDAVIDVPAARLTLVWPETVEFIWAVYGPAGRAALLDELKATADPGVKASAAWLLARDGYAEALPAIRDLARNGAGVARDTAIRALGVYGHPDDFEFLVDGVAAAVKADPADADAGNQAEAFVDALGEYGDLRGAAPMAALVRESKDETLKARTRMLFVNLLTPETLALLRAEGAALPEGDDKAAYDEGLARLFAAMDLTAAEYDALPAADQEAKLAAFRADLERDYRPRPDEPAASRQQLLTLLDRVREGGRLFDDGADAATAAPLPRQVLAQAQAADVPALLEARAVVAQRVTGQALADMDILSAMVVRIMRAGYRIDPGVCAEVKPMAVR